MKKTACLFASMLLLSMLCTPIFAQQTTTDTLTINELAPVTVSAYRLETNDLATPLSITTIGQRQLQTGTQQLGLDEALVSVPGVFVQNGSNFAQDLRVSIRGFGARSAFGIRGVKVMVDGFPESTPDGTAQVDAVDPGSLTGVSVIRSGTGGLYGNASGGLLSFSTLKFNDEEWGEVAANVGSYGFHKSQLRFGGGKANKFLYSLNGSLTGTEGYRDHSAMRSYLLNGGFLIPVDSTMTIKGVLTYVNSPVALDPGGIYNYDNDGIPRISANEDNIYYDVGESLWQLRMGIGITKQFTQQHSIAASFFQTNRSFSSRLVSDIVEFERSFTGGIFSYSFKTKPTPINWQITAGLDLEKQNDDRKRFDTHGDGIKGDQYVYQTEIFATTGLYLVQKLALGKHFLLLSSLRYDDMQFAVDDKFLNDGDINDLNKKYNSINPTFGLSIMLSPNIYIVANHGRNFETPTLQEIGQEGDDGLKPQRSRTTELGYKIRSANGKFRFEPTVFMIRLQDEIIRFDNNTGTNFLENAGSSDRRGAEFALDAQFSKHIYGQFNYTFSDFKYDEYGEFSGKFSPNIPSHKLDMMLGYSNPNGLSFAIGSNRIGSTYVYFDNEVEIRGFWYGYLRTSYTLEYKSNQFEFFGGINNIYNHWYYSNVRLTRFEQYEPAPLRNYYTGLKIRF